MLKTEYKNLLKGTIELITDKSLFAVFELSQDNFIRFENLLYASEDIGSGDFDQALEKHCFNNGVDWLENVSIPPSKKRTWSFSLNSYLEQVGASKKDKVIVYEEPNTSVYLLRTIKNKFSIHIRRDQIQLYKDINETNLILAIAGISVDQKDLHDEVRVPISKKPAIPAAIAETGLTHVEKRISFVEDEIEEVVAELDMFIDFSSLEEVF